MDETTGRRGPGRPRTPVGRERLLEVAAGMFATHGYTGASMSDIAKAAGIQKSSLFHHFVNKEALYVEAVTRVASGLGRLVFDALRTWADRTAIERLDRLGHLVTVFLGEHPRAARLLLREMVDRGPFIAGVGSPWVQTVLTSASALIEQAVAEHTGAGPAQGAIDTRHAAVSILGLHLTWFAADAISGRLAGETVHDPDAVARRSRQIQLQVRGLCGLPAAPQDLSSGLEERQAGDGLDDR